MIKELSQYRNSLQNFIDYLKKININPMTFFNNDFNSQMGYFVEFLGLKNITICYDSFNYIVYHDNVDIINEHKSIKSIIMHESNNSDITNVLTPIENFKLGLIEAFKHLENPF